MRSPYGWPETYLCGVPGVEGPGPSPRGQIPQRAWLTLVQPSERLGRGRGLRLCCWLWTSHCSSLTSASTSQEDGDASPRQLRSFRHKHKHPLHRPPVRRVLLAGADWGLSISLCTVASSEGSQGQTACEKNDFVGTTESRPCSPCFQPVSSKLAFQNGERWPWYSSLSPLLSRTPPGPAVDLGGTRQEGLVAERRALRLAAGGAAVRSTVQGSP